ncbi:MAG: DNA polymerase III subunit delta [Bacillota bacterium]
MSREAAGAFAARVGAAKHFLGGLVAVDEIASDKRTKKFKPVYLLYGDEEYLRDAAAKEIVDACLDQDDRDFNYTVFRAAETQVSTIATAILSPPAFGARRVVVVRGFGDLSADDQMALAAAIQRMPETSLVILLAKTVDEKTEAYKSISKVGRAVRYRRLFASEATEWLARHARSSGIEIDRGAREYLVRILGTNLAALAGAIQKACDYAGTGGGTPKRLTLEDVKAVISGEPELGIFDLVDAIGERDAPKAVAAMRRLASFGEVPARILAMIARQVRLILQAKALQEQGMNLPRIAAAMRLQDYMVRRYLSQARNFRYDDLEDAFAAMLKTDIELKTSGAPDHILLERLILRLCTHRAVMSSR